MRTLFQVSILRSLIALAVVFTLATQVFLLPAMSGAVVDEFPEAASWRWPVLALSIGWLACVEVVLVCVWKLLAAVRRSHVFDPGSFRWVNLIIAALYSATALSVAAVALALASAIGPISVPAMALLLLLISVGLLLLVIVLRDLLRQATTLKVELDSVV